MLTISRYQSKLAQRPLLTQAVTTAVRQLICQLGRKWGSNVYRCCLVPVTPWPSKLWKEKGFEITMLPEQAE